MKRQELLERREQEAHHIIENEATTRETAKVFGVGKSTISRDMHTCMKDQDYDLYQEVQQQFEQNRKRYSDE